MLKTFKKGGVHPPENKLSAQSAILDLPLPQQVRIPISQHIGAPASVLVKRGDTLKVGQIIAKSEGFVSANIHSSVSGTVSKIDEIIDSSGFRRTAVVIDVEGDEWNEEIDKDAAVKKEVSLDKDQIIQRITEAGIVGLGGATFPSHVKLSIPGGKKVNTLIINGVECEPYLTSDHALMLQHGEEILIGVKILMKALGVSQATIGIENNKPDAISHLTKLAKDFEGVEIQALKVKYPQGGEKQLIKAVTGREVPSGGLPLDVGAVVFNVASAFAVYEAVQKQKPLIERVVTVTGKDVKTPSNYKVRIGISVSDLIEKVGGLPESTGKLISGGPMMGKALANADAPIVKGSSGVLILKEEEAHRKEVQPCIRCAKCLNVCPMGLEPYLLMPLSEKLKWDKFEAERALDCIECGSCSYICPSNRPLLDYIRIGKTTVIKIKRSKK